MAQHMSITKTQSQAEGTGNQSQASCWQAVHMHTYMLVAIGKRFYQGPLDCDGATTCLYPYLYHYLYRDLICTTARLTTPGSIAGGIHSCGTRRNFYSELEREVSNKGLGLRQKITLTHIPT